MAYGKKHSGLERYGKPVDPEDPGKFTLAPDLANPPLPPSFDERLEKIVSNPAGLGYEWGYDDEQGERQKLEIRQLIRDVIERVKPERRSHRSREYQNWPDVVNGHDEAIDELEAKSKELGL